MQYWLIKSEPDVWSLTQQEKAGAKGAVWDGVRNYQARNNEHDAQYNLAFLINSGKGITKNYSEALFWAFLSRLGKIQKEKIRQAQF